jgi:glycosyltransferase involved in cell wall biosynthesis
VISATLIISTYNQPEMLARCLVALDRQSVKDFELIIADDGSDERTARVISSFAERSSRPVTHVWQSDDGFRKTRILNNAINRSSADYLLFMDGDCIAHPDFVLEHLQTASPGHYLNGSMIRLSEGLSDRITVDSINSGDAFRASWLKAQGGEMNRRFLRLALSRPLRGWLNRVSPTQLYWLGANFDNRFTYGFEDGDFGRRLENAGIGAKTVRWTANVLHLWHGRPWSREEDLRRNRQLMTENEEAGLIRTADGLAEVGSEDLRVKRFKPGGAPSEPVG